jgi:TolA-binding protein
MRRLDRSGVPVTFTSVAAASGISRTWLYRHPEIRATIVRLRASRPQPSTPAVPSPQRASIESLRQRLQATNEEIARLRAENQLLRDRIERALGQQRLNPTPEPTPIASQRLQHVNKAKALTLQPFPPEGSR